jgi:hypothetical protein
MCLDVKWLNALLLFTEIAVLILNCKLFFNAAKSYLFRAICLILWVLGSITFMPVFEIKRFEEAFLSSAVWMCFLLSSVILFLIFPKNKIALMRKTTPWFFVHAQVYRILVAGFLMGYFKMNILPFEITWLGYNFDILIGLSAVFISYFLKMGIPFFTKKWFLIGWHISGMVSILVFVGITASHCANFFINWPLSIIPTLILPNFLAFHLLAIHQSYKQWAYVIPVDYD